MKRLVVSAVIVVLGLAGAAMGQALAPYDIALRAYGSGWAVPPSNPVYEIIPVDAASSITQSPAWAAA
jgi:hypothetical protein